MDTGSLLRVSTACQLRSQGRLFGGGVWSG